ncbi:MAG TPA: hypothetical protein VK879_19605 [Candidatus Sulfomarinibacteraceae bacterium]|nr:hypothetical protein [Candidatus Sulfomarinibacteraceae bacterium]
MPIFSAAGLPASELTAQITAQARVRSSEDDDQFAVVLTAIGEAALSPDDRQVLGFLTEFEQTFVGQGNVERSIDETLDLAWQLLGQVPVRLLKRVPQQLIEKYIGGA